MHKIEKYIYNLLFLVSVALLASFVIVIQNTNTAQALSASDFNAGNIVSDFVFTNKDSMSVSQIQSFLNSKVTTCDTNGTQLSEYGGPDLNSDGKVQRWEWGKANYNQTTFPCLKDYKVDNKSAAQIIYDASQEFLINPQVLIVLLQKEQALVTDTWPLNIQYRSATGYGCPDTAACDSQYYGLVNQLRWAATMYRAIMNDSPTWYTPYILGNNYIQYNPDSSCGGSTVNIVNRATKALYNYTPYQPSTAVLDWKFNGGAYPNCGAYGNLNFFVYFSEWFGSTTGTPFFQLPGSPVTYIIGADNSYYVIDDYDVLLDYGFMSSFEGRVTRVPSSHLTEKTNKGTLPVISRFEDDSVYAISNGKIHPFNSADTFRTYGYSFGQEATLPNWIKLELKASSQMEPILKLSDNDTIYNMADGKKQPFCSWDAYTTIGSPEYSTRKSVTLDSSFSNKLAIGAPIATEGTLIRTTNSTSYGIWQNSLLLSMDPVIAKSTGLGACSVSDISYQQLSKSVGVLKNLVKDSSNNLFSLDRSKKITIPNSELSNFGLAEANFTMINNSFLNKLPTSSIPELYRINSQDSVYYMTGGTSYSIPSPDDLYALGYNFNQVMSISQATADIWPNNGVVYKPGRVVRIDSKDTVYLLDSDFVKHPFASAEVFLGYGYNWGNVKNISSTNAKAYTSGPMMSQFIKDNSNPETYWLISSGVLHKLSPLLSGIEGFNITSDKSVSLTNSTLSRIPTGSEFTKIAFRSGNTDTVYTLDNGKKRAFASASAFLSFGYSWDDVVSLSPSIVDSLLDGEIIK